MNRLLLSLSVLIIFAGGVVAQSGRRVANPPPPPPPPEPVKESLRSEPADTPLTPVNMSALPESLMNRALKSLDNNTFRLADFSGKVIVVNLWATWCGPCRVEIPDYEKVRKEYAGRDVEFIALTTEDPIAARERVQKFARDFHFGFRIGWADRETARTLMNGRNVIPQTLVIGTDGRIVNHWTGYSAGRSRDRLRDAIESALAKSAQNIPVAKPSRTTRDLRGSNGLSSRLCIAIQQLPFGHPSSLFARKCKETRKLLLTFSPEAIKLPAIEITAT